MASQALTQIVVEELHKVHSKVTHFLDTSPCNYELVTKWLQNPKLRTDNQWVLIEEVAMFEFFQEAINFELLLDNLKPCYSTCSQKAFEALTHNPEFFEGIESFDALEKTLEVCTETLEVSGTQVILICRLLEYCINTYPEKTLSLFLNKQTWLVLLYHINCSFVQHFLHFKVVSNQELPIHVKNTLSEELLPKVLEKLLWFIELEINLEGTAEFLSQLITEALANPTPTVDELNQKPFFPCNSASLFNLLFVRYGKLLVKRILNASFKHPKQFSEVKYQYLDILVSILQSLRQGALSCMRSELNSLLSPEVTQELQKEVTHFKPPTHSKSIALNTYTVQNPINLFALNTIRVLTYTLELKPNLARTLETSCWTKLFNWVFYFKNNGMLCSLIKRLGTVFINNSSEHTLKEVFINQKILEKALKTTSEEASPGEKDLHWCLNNLMQELKLYTKSHSDTFTQEVLNYLNCTS